MYGTVARLKIKPGSEDWFKQYAERSAREIAEGFVFSHVYKLDSGGDEYILVVAFTDKDAYVANANSPDQHKRYEEYRAHLAADPEWNDGEIIQSVTA
jgi:heme-degrading monooxygenase HmoA